MGYMTTYVVLNDAANGLKDNPDVGNTMRDMLLEIQNKPLGTVVEGRIEGCGNGVKAVSQHHADTVSVILVGGNHATEVGRVANSGRCHERDDVVDVLGLVANGLGFKLVKLSRQDRIRSSVVNRRLLEDLKATCEKGHALFGNVLKGGRAWCRKCCRHVKVPRKKAKARSSKVKAGQVYRSMDKRDNDRELVVIKVVGRQATVANRITGRKSSIKTQRLLNDSPKSGFLFVGNALPS